MSPSKTALIRVNEVSVRREQTEILRDFSWTVRAGEHWIIFGPNGAGKTTLLNALLGYLWPTDGTIEVLGERLGTGVDIRELRTEMAVVSDAVKAMIAADLTGEEVLVTGARAHLNLFSPPSREEKELAHRMAEFTGTEYLLQKPYEVMSTGERQRIAIARALMLLPQIVILDEPCAGLDLAGREWVLQTIERIASAPDAPTLLLTTHHVEEVTPSFTHALLIRDGRSLKSGPLKKAFTGSALSELFNLPLQLTNVNGRWAAQLTENPV